MTVSELLSALSLRLRGPAHSEVLMKAILTHCQRIVNSHIRTVLKTDTLSTNPHQQVYSMALMPDALRVESVQEGNRDLAPIMWDSLGEMDRKWFRRVASRFETFSKIGRNVLVINPAKPEASSVSVISTKLTAALSVPTDVVELDDQDLLPVLDLAEAVLLVRERRFQSLPELLARLRSRLGFPHVESKRASVS